MHNARPATLEWKAKHASNQHSADTRRAASEPQQFPALELVNRPTVPTEQAAYYLLRRPQTLRGWACAETFPDGLRPIAHAMAVCAGLCRASRPHWGWRDDRRNQSPAAGALVRCPIPLVSTWEGRQMKTPEPSKENPSAPNKREFTGTDNPRHLPTFVSAAPAVLPTWPKRGTLADRALGMLMDGRLIDHPDFENSTQSWRLGAVIFTLRTLGWPVETIEVPSPTDIAPPHHCLYRLDPPATPRKRWR
jgi:hypothetical protein